MDTGMEEDFPRVSLVTASALLPGKLVTMRLEGYGLWPAVVMKREDLLWATAHSPSRAIVPLRSTCVLTLGDRALAWVDEGGVVKEGPPLLVDRPDRGKMYRSAVEEAEEYATAQERGEGGVGRYALWLHPSHPQPYVSVLVECTPSKLVLRTREGGDEEVPPSQWSSVRWIGPPPPCFDEAEEGGGSGGGRQSDRLREPRRPVYAPKMSEEQRAAIRGVKKKKKKQLHGQAPLR